MPVSLHTHSWYSLLEGVTAPVALLERAAALGYTTLALTDTNNLYGAPAFVDAAPLHGIRPLLGACLRHTRERCVALVADAAGYRNLCRVLSRLHLGSTSPFTLSDILNPCAEGLHLLVDDPVLAERLREAFGSRLWLEVIRPPRSARHEADLLACGQRLRLPLVASTAVHFATPADYPTFRLVTAVRQTTLLERIPARMTVGPEHHLVELPELRRRFRDLPRALENADALAEQLRSDVLPGELILPQPQLRKGLEENHYLGCLCERGLRRREMGDRLGARQRLREELTIIEASGLAGYFLVVRDIARYARRRGYSMALRGSAGNSLVCYLLEITEVNPLRFGLPLERFLHAGRRDLPDIDLDFDWKVRDEVIAYAKRRHGDHLSAQICTHLFLQPRSAFREAAKIHGLSDGQIGTLLERLASRVETLLAPESPPADEQAGEVPLSRLVADARRLMGRPHHLSIHPGGIVLTPRPMEEYVPLQRAPKGVIITQYDKDGVERIGLVKIDLLGNRALATVDEAQRILKVHHLPSPRAAPDDPAIRDLLRRGDTLGVNQLESPAMRHLLIQIKAQTVEDVIRSLALIRPGAASLGMKEVFIRRLRGQDPVCPVHPRLDPVLCETQGVMLYEDDALRVIQALTGLDAPAADRLRKRVSKHSTEAEARALGEEFLAACSRQDIPRSVAADVWVQLAKFNQYSFCKSHAVSYGLIAWQATALKTYQPLAFWTAALNNNQGMYPRRVYIEAIKRAGIPVLLPCINRSQISFGVEDQAIRTGLGAIAGLDQGFQEALIAERERAGPYRTLADLRRRLLPGPETLALLIRSGALDMTGRSRSALFLEADLQGPNGPPRDELFAPTTEGWTPVDYDASRRRHDEWQLLGFVVGEPLLAPFRPHLPRHLITSRDLPRYLGRRVQVAGLTATARHTLTTDGRPMQFVTLEDEWGLIEVTLFPGACPPVAHLAVGPYLASGVVEDHHGVLSVSATRFERHPICSSV